MILLALRQVQIPRVCKARTLLGLSYYGARRFAEAAEELERVIKASPPDTELLQALAQSCLGAKRYSCALEQYQQILQKDPNSSAAHTLAGEALDGLGRTPEAITEFQTAINVAPKEPNLHFGLGYLYWKSRQYDNAAVEFNNELAIDPENAQALAYLGDVEFKRDHPEKALVLLRKAVGTRNDIRVAYLDIGAILAHQNQHMDVSLRCCGPKNWIPRNPTFISGWGACIKPWETSWRRRRNSPNYANCTRNPRRTSAPRCQGLRRRRNNKH